VIHAGLSIERWTRERTAHELVGARRA
jgi:hypothetical protein